jgi:hypothetical protein
MSLDFYLEDDAGGQLYWRNITHNLGRMAREAGIYECLWRPGEHGLEIAEQVIPKLREGLTALVCDPPRFKHFDAPNGWGLYEHFVPFCIDVLEACMENPKAKVRASI